MGARCRHLGGLSGARWVPAGPLLTGWRGGRVGRGLGIGHPPRRGLRGLLDAVLWVVRTGIAWRCFPHTGPHWNGVWHCFGRGEKGGILERLDALMRRRVREGGSRLAEPAAVVIDAQSIMACAGVPAVERGADARR
ncbi:transposase [Streptomyces sp. NBC_01381]|uniref:transposase n=1 Tax=Streptomyces sp. NBC_01381 TaxID=2903845 RepID=UPI00224FC7E9|nr:transposase [Streptomyces sp. NBC_01381]MCX4672387.1 transposase [Streptomyces sp. NBC_01381]MCX4673439.1 transposase [Streptomyces sp. NBC_01381]MCX4673448.1 transposase [Streptomyces sp. NBC_01381]